MTSEEKAELAKIFRAALEEHSNHDHRLIAEAIESHARSESHLFITALMERERRRQEIWERLKGNILLWLVVTTLSGVGIAVYQTFIKH